MLKRNEALTMMRPSDSPTSRKRNTGESFPNLKTEKNGVFPFLSKDLRSEKEGENK